MRKNAPLAVEVPAPDRDNPGWVKVGVIAAVGFAIGIAWPRVVGVKLGPSAPGEAASAAAAAASASANANAATGRASTAPPASVTKSGALATATGSAGSLSTAVASPSASGPPQVNVPRGAVIHCKLSDGETKKGKECGTIAGLDNVVGPHLRKLAACSAAEGQTGKLSFVATADFPSGRLSWDVGKSSTVGNLDGIGNCLKTHFSGVTATGVAHEHQRYTVAYVATFAPPLEEAAVTSKVDKADRAAKSDTSEKPDTASKNAKDDKHDDPGGAPLTAAAASEASVGWEVALVRDVPKTGQVVARLPRGSKVKLGAMKDGWYAIKYGDGFTGDGFIYRAAIGR